MNRQQFQAGMGAIRTARCRMAILVLLFTRRHAMLACEIAAALHRTYSATEVHDALAHIESSPAVYDAPATITWTTGGWLISPTGCIQVEEILKLRKGAIRAHHNMTERKRRG